MKLEFSGHIFDKSSNIKSHENSLNGGPNCFKRTYRRPDVYEEANSSFSQFCEQAWKQQETKQDSTMASRRLIH